MTERPAAGENLDVVRFLLSSIEALARAGFLASAILTAFATAIAAEDWPQLLGPQRNGIVAGPAVEPWPGPSPKLLWRIDIGEGFAGPAVVGERLLLAHRIDRKAVLEAIDTADGTTQWRVEEPTTYRDQFGWNGGPRATPTVAGDLVFTLGATGTLSAVELESGRRVWRRDTASDYRPETSFFGVATSPLVIGGKVLVNLGGREANGIVAFDRATGATLWSTTDDEASYSSPVAAALADRQAAVFFTREGLVILDPSDGAVRSRFPWKTRIRASVNAATPLVVGNRIFLSASYGAGAILLDLSDREPRRVWSSDRALTNHYATSIHHRGFLYGFHGRQEARPAFRCIELNTGEVRWSEDRFGAGTVILVGDRLLVLKESGELLLVAASPDAFQVLARAQALKGSVRAYPAYSNGRFYARNDRELVAYALN